MTKRSTLATRRRFVQQLGALASVSAAGVLVPTLARAQSAKLRIGLMLPYTGTFAALGTAITQGFNIALEEGGGKLGGREVQFFTVDDESEPSKATDNANRLVQRDKVDVLVGTVHSGVVMAMVKIARDTETLLVIPNAGANAATGSQCAPNIFRTSFSNWQPAHPMGKVMYERGHRKVVTLTWKYGAGEESIESFKEAFTKLGGSIVKEMYLPFPNVEFQPFITEIASLKPDAVFVFFAGGGAVKFTKDYAAAGLKDKIPLYGSGFLTDGTLEAQGASAQGLLTTLHYGDGIDNPKNKQFRYAYGKKYGVQADVYAVQGYDAALLLAGGLTAVRGSFGDKKALYSALEKVKIDSPRGPWTMSRAHNPIQDIYLRRVEGNANQVIGVAWKALEDPARGCKMQA
jgi:branched-chain amino acid transport system substrate-binding protein